MTIAEIEYENFLADRHQKLELAEREFETERAARRRRLKQAEMSMLEFKARAAAITGSKNLQQNSESQVSRATTCKRLTSGSYKDAEQQQDHDSLNESMETVKDRNTKPSKTGQTIELGVPKLDAEPETTSTNATTRPSFVPQYEPSTEKKFSSTSIPDRQWINDHL